MPETSDTINIEHYFELVLKHRWFIMIPFCLAMVVGICLAIMLPRMYMSSTLILVRPQHVPENYVQSIITSDIESRISTISQQILSRTNLEKIINQFNLFMGPKYDDMFMEDKIADLRKRIQIKFEGINRRKNAEAFSIAFSGAKPELVMRVANGLATYFIDENLKVREAQAVGTSEFLENELQSSRRRLVEVEAKLKEYRRVNMGELPEQLESNLRVLDRLQEQLNQRQESLRDAKVSLVALESEIQTRNQMRMAMVPNTAGGEPDENTLNLMQLKERLAALKTTYTDKHPDVIRLENKIKTLEAEIPTKPGQQTNTSGAGYAQVPLSGPEADIIRQRIEFRGEIQSSEIEIARIKTQIKDYQQRVEAIPRHEQELMSLQRDYENIQASYNSLLNRKLEAEIAVNMEKKQKGEQFRILDPAQLPEKPMSPNLQRLFILTIALGLGVGGGLIFLKDYFDSSIRLPEEIKRDMGITVFASIPKIYQKRDYRRKRVNQVATVLSMFVCACLLGAFAVLVFNGIEPTIEVVRRFARI